MDRLYLNAYQPKLQKGDGVNAFSSLNGHKYLKRQLEKHGMEFTALDNGILCCNDASKARQLADDLRRLRLHGLIE